MSVSTAALIARDERFLFVRRPVGGDLSECWELPGGKVDPGETAPQALKRELHEELGVAARVGPLVAHGTFRRGAAEYDLLAFLVTVDENSLELREHTELCWCTLEEGLALDLAPSDRKLIRQMVRPAGERSAG